jgi:hypothetical protein
MQAYVVCDIISLMEPLRVLVFLLQVADEFIKRRTETDVVTEAPK